MQQLKICFIGIGSIAKRHIKNLLLICEEKGIEVTLDVVHRSGLLDCSDILQGIRKIYKSVAEINESYDAIFITNPTEYHLETLTSVERWGKAFFIEKPFVSGGQMKEGWNHQFLDDKVYYVACPLRYHPVVQYLTDYIKTQKVFSVQCTCSSYLPEWRPGVDYRQTYSAHKDLGGGVAIDLIHEWDYLSQMFGFPETVQKILGKKSSLEIDCEDVAVYLAEYEGMVLELHLDYFGRVPIRQLRIFTEQDTVEADILKGEIRFGKTGEILRFENNRDTFQCAELKHFLQIIDKKIKCDSTPIHGLQVLALTQGEII